MKFKVSIRYCVEVEAKDEDEAIDIGYTEMFEEFSLTEHQLGLATCEVEEMKGPKQPS